MVSVDVKHHVYLLTENIVSLFGLEAGEAEGSALDTASALSSLQKGCGLWTLSFDFVPHSS